MQITHNTTYQSYLVEITHNTTYQSYIVEITHNTADCSYVEMSVSSKSDLTDDVQELPTFAVSYNFLSNHTVLAYMCLSCFINS